MQMLSVHGVYFEYLVQAARLAIEVGTDADFLRALNFTRTIQNRPHCLSYFLDHTSLMIHALWLMRS
jgi:hypothetical protein